MAIISAHYPTLHPADLAGFQLINESYEYNSIELKWNCELFIKVS